jgi:hypothetical protein
MTLPILDLPWTYQHHYQLNNYLQSRDATTNTAYWQSTAIEFMNAVHPLPGEYRSLYWHAARRSTRIFDWIGHGRNQAKRVPPLHPTPDPSPSAPFPCPHCGQRDDQAHIMLICSLPALTPIRQRAKRLQSVAASRLRLKYHSDVDRYIIDQLLFASWTLSSTHTRRIWLGMWTTQLLNEVLPPHLASSSPMQTPDRYKYRKLIRKLTFPLTYAYRQMLKLYRPRSSIGPQCHRQTKTSHEPTHSPTSYHSPPSVA